MWLFNYVESQVIVTSWIQTISDCDPVLGLHKDIKNIVRVKAREMDDAKESGDEFVKDTVITFGRTKPEVLAKLVMEEI